METPSKAVKIDLNQVLAERCRREFFFFVKYFWDTISAEPPLWNWHIEFMCNNLQETGIRVKKRLPKLYDFEIYNVPPGSTKSTIVSEMYPLWCWTIDPVQQFICGSYASTPAEDIAEKCFRIFNSDKFKTLFPELTKNATGGKTNFQNGLFGKRYTTSTGSAITGVHAHQKLVDDPMNPQIAASKVERENANKWLSETLGTRNIDDNITTTIIVMQRLHEQDSTGFVLAKQAEGLRVNHICIPVEISDQVKPAYLKQYYVDGLFDPIRKPRHRLATLKIELGSYGYASQMEQTPSPEGGGLLKKDWFKVITYDNFLEATKGKPVIWHFDADTAYTEKQHNDPSGFMASAYVGNILYIRDAMEVWDEFPDLVKSLPQFANRNGYTSQSKIHVEPKASGKSVVQVLKSSTGLNIIEAPTPKDDKVVRANSVSPFIETGRVVLIEGYWNDAFLHQVAAFPKGKHDEYVDLLSQAISRCNKPAPRLATYGGTY